MTTTAHTAAPTDREPRPTHYAQAAHTARTEREQEPGPETPTDLAAALVQAVLAVTDCDNARARERERQQQHRHAETLTALNRIADELHDANAWAAIRTYDACDIAQRTREHTAQTQRVADTLDRLTGTPPAGPARPTSPAATTTPPTGPTP